MRSKGCWQSEVGSEAGLSGTMSITGRMWCIQENNNTYVKGAVTPEANTAEQCLHYLNHGLSKRQVSRTQMNTSGSSRSHVIFTIKVKVHDSLENKDSVGKVCSCSAYNTFTDIHRWVWSIWLVLSVLPKPIPHASNWRFDYIYLFIIGLTAQ